MIVQPASLENGRTVWRFEAEAEDVRVPGVDLWIDGLVHKIPDHAETVLLALALGPFARRRLVVPGFVRDGLRETLERVAGVHVVADNVAKRELGAPGEFAVTLIRDSIDVYLASIAKSPATFLVDVHADPGRVGEVSTSLRTASNAGVLRRDVAPLDGIGEIGVAQLLSQSLMAKNVTSYLCREELSGIGDDGLKTLLRHADVALSLPLAGIEAASLGGVLVELGLHPVACFRGLWRRYQAFPEIIGAIYRDLEDRLDDFDLTHDTSLRVAAEMARLTGARAPTRSPRADALTATFHFPASGRRRTIV